jgi:hypothetical protein
MASFRSVGHVTPRGVAFGDHRYRVRHTDSIKKLGCKGTAKSLQDCRAPDKIRIFLVD